MSPLDKKYGRFDLRKIHSSIRHTTNSPQTVIRCEASNFYAAESLLREISQTFPEIVERFLDGIDGLFQLARFDVDFTSASRAGEFRISLQPSDFFIEFLSAMRTRQLYFL